MVIFADVSTMAETLDLDSIVLDFPGHPWLQTIASAPDKPLDSAVLSRLKQFSAMNKLKKMALRVNKQAASFLL